MAHFVNSNAKYHSHNQKGQFFSWSDSDFNFFWKKYWHTVLPWVIYHYTQLFNMQFLKGFTFSQKMKRWYNSQQPPHPSSSCCMYFIWSLSSDTLSNQYNSTGGCIALLLTMVRAYWSALALCSWTLYQKKEASKGFVLVSYYQPLLTIESSS